MADKPILFSGPMVRALLDGRKTQTRRVLKGAPADAPKDAVAYQPHPEDHAHIWAIDSRGIGPDEYASRTPFSLRPGAVEYWRSATLPYAIGDRLWVREAWSFVADNCWTVSELQRMRNMVKVDLFYRADPPEMHRSVDRWFSSIHMPRWVSRLTLTVTDVRVQRLQEISEADVIAEGVEHRCWDVIEGWSACRFNAFKAGVGETAVEGYQLLWNSINGPGAWDVNPWVVAASFTVGRHNIDQVPA